MEIKQIIEALQTRFEGVSDVVLERIAKKISKTITDEATLKTAVDAVTFQQIIDSYADYRATEAQKTAVSTYEKKYNLKDGKVIETPPSKPVPQTEEMPAWAQALVEQLNSQKEIITAMSAERATVGRKAKLDEALKTMPASVKTRYEKDFARLNFKDDDDFNTWLEEAKTDFAQMSNAFQQKGALFQPPFVGGGGEKKTEAQIEMAKNIAKKLVHD